jgi:hypothetical protein
VSRRNENCSQEWRAATIRCDLSFIFMQAHQARMADPFRALLLVGVFAFFAGFMGYLALSLGQPDAGRILASAPAPAADYAPVRLSPPQDPWVFEKSI